MNNNKLTLTLSLSILFLGHFLVDFMIGIWPIYKTIAHLDLAKVGLIGGLCAFAGEGCQTIFGSLSDRGYRKLLIIGGLVMAGASVLLAYADNYAIIFVLCFLTCLGSGAFHPSAISALSELSENRKGLVISIFASGGALGMATGQLIFSETYHRLNGQVMVLLIPSVILALITCFYQRIKSIPNLNPSKTINLKIFGTFFRRPDLRWLYISQVCNATIMWGLMFLLPDVLLIRHYEPWIVYGSGHLALILGGAMMMIPGGYIADKFSSQPVIFYSTLLGLVFFYCFLLIPHWNNIATLTLLFLTGASLGIINPVSVALGTRLAPEHKASIGAFLMGMVWCIAEGIGQCGGGVLTSLFTEDAPAKALEIIGGLFLVGLLAAVRLPQETKKLQKQVEYA